MATSITGQFNYKWQYGSLSDTRTFVVNETVAAIPRYVDVWNVGTSEESLAFPPGGITTEGRCLIVNSDATNYCQIGFATGVYPLRLNAGEFMWVRIDPSITTLYTKANASAVNLEISVYSA